MRKQKRALAYVLSAVISLMAPFTSMADSWQKTQNQWSYVSEENGMRQVVKDSWKFVDGNWYYFDADGVMQTGWHHDKNGAWYYLNMYSEGIEGSMRTGWYQDSISKKWYWLHPYEGADIGKMQTGWIYDGNHQYFLGADGAWIPGYTESDSDDPDHGTIHNPENPTPEDPTPEDPTPEDPTPEDPDPDKPVPDIPGEEEGVQVIQTKENVISFDAATDEGLRELEQVYEEIYDYWTDDNGTPEDVSDDTYNVVVGNHNPMYQYISDGTYRANDVIYIPACEYFPTGVSLVYLYHDDGYMDDMDFDEHDFEVIHTRRAVLTDLFDENEEVSFSIDEISDENPVSFVWVPQFSYADDDEKTGMATYAFSRNGVMEEAGELTGTGLMRKDSQMTPGQAALAVEADFGADDDVKGKGFQGQNLGKIYPKADFSDIQKGEIGIDFDKIVLFDFDGKKSTTADRVVIDGEFTLADINPELALDWKFKLSDPLPQQFLARLGYKEIKNVKLTVGGDLGDLKDVYKEIKKSMGAQTHNNKRSIFGIDINGVDMSNTIVIGAAGINLGTKTVKLSIKSLRDQSIKVPLAPSVIVMFLMDINGNISTTLVGEYTSTSYVEKGVNVQKQGYIGSHGTCAQNQGQKNFTLAGRNVNIYDLQAKSKTEKNKKPVSEISITMDGKAEAKLGVGAGMGVMFAGIIPAMVKATIGPEAEADLSGKATYSTETGISFEGQATLDAALVVRAKADVNLTAKTFFGTPGITGSWDLAKVNLLQFSLSSKKLEGQVFESDSDRDEDNNPKISGAQVTLTRKNTVAGNSAVLQTVTDADGRFTVSGIAPDTYKLNIKKDGYLEYETELDVSANKDRLKIYLDKSGESARLTGTVHKADEDADVSNNEALPDVKVTVTKVGSSTQKPQTLYTGSDGRYTAENLPLGLYEILFEKDGYIPIRNEVIIVSGGTIHNTSMEIISNEYVGTGTANGQIINALNAAPVGGGIELTVKKGINASGGEVIAVTQTDQEGRYSLTLPAGNYTVLLHDGQNQKRYRDDRFYIKVLGNMTLDGQDGEMIPVLDEDEIRVVLTWGASPRDLDSHMTGPATDGGRFHVFYSNKNYRENGTKKVGLDVDDTTSYGPETITIYNPSPGVYRYAVHDYTNRGSSISDRLANSGAYVRVYKSGNDEVRAFHVPSEPGTVWNVFDYNSETGEITAVNTMEYQSNPSLVARAGRADSRNRIFDDLEEELPLKPYELAELHATPSNAEEIPTASPSDAEETPAASPSDAEEIPTASPSNAEGFTKASPSDIVEEEEYIFEEELINDLEQNDRGRETLPLQKGANDNDIIAYGILQALKKEQDHSPVQSDERGGDE